MNSKHDDFAEKTSWILAINRILVARARDVREENFRERAKIRKSFLPRKFPTIRNWRTGLN